MSTARPPAPVRRDRTVVLVLLASLTLVVVAAAAARVALDLGWVDRVGTAVLLRWCETSS